MLGLFDPYLHFVRRQASQLVRGSLQTTGTHSKADRDADIWILDEPTSSLDPEAEAGPTAATRSSSSCRLPGIAELPSLNDRQSGFRRV
jgi:hypothetical protein